MPEHEKMDIFIDNINKQMSYNLKMQCHPSFKKMIDNGIGMEETMINKEELKIYKEGINPSPNNTTNNNNNDKPKFWNKN